MVCGDTRPCSPHVDEGLESLLPGNILSEEYCYEYKEDMDRKEHDSMDEESPTYDIDGSDDYSNFINNPTCENLIKNPINDKSSRGSVDTWEIISMEEDVSRLIIHSKEKEVGSEA